MLFFVSRAIRAGKRLHGRKWYRERAKERQEQVHYKDQRKDSHGERDRKKLKKLSDELSGGLFRPPFLCYDEWEYKHKK